MRPNESLLFEPSDSISKNDLLYSCLIQESNLSFDHIVWQLLFKFHESKIVY